MKFAALLAALLTVGAVSAFMAHDQDAFNHEKHQNLFPMCEGCHLGISQGDSARFYPAATACANCHDGEQEKRVSWSAPRRRTDNLRYDHVVHAAAERNAGARLECEACHTPAGAKRMSVQHAVTVNCFGCHAHRARDHLVDATCRTCHVPLAVTAFSRERMLELPTPATHRAADFLAAAHGRLADADVASCSVCHTRERCTNCHVNPQKRAIAAMPAAPRTLELPSWKAKYPVPTSHKSPAWLEQHGRDATVLRCSTCHTQDGCASCHRTRAPAVVAALPQRRAVVAPGVVTMKMRAPPSHEAPGFVRAHGTLAATKQTTCSQCHTLESCTSCHVQSFPAERSTANRPARANTSFHPPAFMLRHSSTAYGRRLECSNCHDVRRFCRDCHTQSGLSTATGSGRLQRFFHDAEPLWLLRHARAARQGLESCTSCHTQKDCLQCHGAIGPFRVNPHGDNFDARRAQKRNAVICFACHLTDPVGSR